MPKHIKQKYIKNKKKHHKKYIKNNINNINTILDILRWTSSKFNASNIYYGHGTNNFWDETLQLILPALYLPIDLPTTMYNANLTNNEISYIIKLVYKRINMHIPVPYLINQAWFYGLKFYVDQRVFIPRSPLGKLINSNYNHLLPKSPKYILDLCTGSGCIAIALALIYPQASIDASDISSDALKVAEYNIQLYKLDKQIIPIKSNLFNNLPQIKYDLIISNPPYVTYKEICNLPKEFKSEPIISLIAGNNGLKFILKILIYSPNYMNTNGILICETGNAKNELIKLYPHVPFYWVQLNYIENNVFILTRYQLILYNKTFINTKINK